MEFYDGFHANEGPGVASTDFKDKYKRVGQENVINLLLALNDELWIVWWIEAKLMYRGAALNCGVWASEIKILAPDLP